MNDFTKSELAIIHLAVMRDMNQFAHILKTSPSMIELRDKLEAMLENYCEHDWQNTCCQCSMNSIHCYKCDTRMSHD
jgi:hypothetical protein